MTHIDSDTQITELQRENTELRNEVTQLQYKLQSMQQHVIQTEQQQDSEQDQKSEHKTFGQKLHDIYFPAGVTNTFVSPKVYFERIFTPQIFNTQSVPATFFFGIWTAIEAFVALAFIGSISWYVSPNSFNYFFAYNGM